MMADKRSEGSAKRQNSKQERQKGMAYINSIGIDVKSWAKKNDPLFGIKGKERHLKRSSCSKN